MNKTQNFYWKLCGVFCLAALISAAPELSFASTTDSSSDVIGCTLNRIVKRVTGRIGKGIATLAVIFLGIGLFFGKLSWGLAIAIAIGIGGIFGASQIVDWLGGSTANTDGVCDVTTT